MRTSLRSDATFFIWRQCRHDFWQLLILLLKKTLKSMSALGEIHFLLSNTSSLIYCLIYAYYGHALGSIALSQSGMGGLANSPLGLFMLLLGIVATVIVTVIVTRTSIRVLRESIGEEE